MAQSKAPIVLNVSGLLLSAAMVFAGIIMCAAVDTFDNARDFMIGIYLVGFGAFGVVTEFLYLCVAAASRRGLLSALIGKMPKVGKRQTVMFSATWPSTVHALATQFLSDPLHVGIGSVDEGMVANTAIRQLVEVVKNDKEKQTMLLKHLKQYYAPNIKIIIFGLYKKETAWLESFLHEKGYDKVIALQGDMTQDKRTQAIADFKATKKTPLIATDVASRGLDVQDVELVINYTFPLTIEDYVHRIGRTGRAGKKGLAICYFSPDSKGAQDEKAHAGDLAKVLRDAGQEVPKDLQAVADTSGGNKATKKKAHPLFGAHFKSAEQMAALEAKKVHKTFEDSDDE